MKWYTILAIVFFSLSVTQCDSSKKASETTQVKFESQPEIRVNSPYFIKRIDNEQSDISSYTVFFPDLINKKNYKIEKVYFRKQVGNMEVGKTSYFANLRDKSNDIIMSNKPNAEYGNTMPNASKNFMFELKDNECVISYIANNEIKYYKIDNLVEKFAE